MFLLLILLLWGLPVAHPPPKPVLLLNATVHLGDGTTLPNAALAITADTISLLADARAIRMDMSYFEVVGLYGSHVYAAQLVDSADSLTWSTTNLAVPLDSGRQLVLRPPASKPFRLREGGVATLMVTDTLVAEGSQARVLRAYLNGQAVALPDSVEHIRCH